MKELFKENGLIITEREENLFNKYFDLLSFYNEKFNITAITEKKEVFLKHFLDSALGTKKINGKNLVDIGSGGGFPAIPLKILNDELNVTLIEATGKKCEFLKTLIYELGLKNVSVINGRAEDLAKDEKYRERFDVCTARAVARLNTLLEYCFPFVKIGGSFVAYKGDAEEEILEAKNAVKVLGGEVIDVFKYTLSDAKRTLITVKKVKKTDPKYPRGNGKERKNPL